MSNKIEIERVVVLAPGSIGPDDRFANFQDDIYVGGQVRMEAAAQVLKSNPGIEMTLVGGYNRARDMGRFLLARVPDANLRFVSSLPCTRHNFEAVLADWEFDNVEIGAGEVGILTNAYHSKRAEIFARLAIESIQRYQHVRFVPMIAEDILGLSIDSIVEDSEDAYAARLASEYCGVEQIRAGTYIDSCLP